MPPAAFSAGAPTPNDPLYLAAEQVKIERILNSHLNSVAVTGTRMVAAGERGHIIISDDGGKNWRQVPVPVSVTLTKVFFPTPLSGWAVGYGGVILHTRDGGNTWEKQMDRTRLNPMMTDWLTAAVKSVESSNEAADGSRLDNLRFSLEDWRKNLSGDTCPPFMDLWFKDETHGFAVGAFGLFVGTGDGGKTWSPLLQVDLNPENLHYYGIAPSLDGRLIVTGEMGMILYSGDTGRTWQRRTSPYEGSLFGVIGRADHPGLLAYGLRGHIIYSQDSGLSWTSGPPMGEGNLYAGKSAPNGGFILANSLGEIFITDFLFKERTRLDRTVEGIIDLSGHRPGQLVVVGFNGVGKIPY